jgi:Immunoglobulin-like domain of bacterial spore germination/Sporulation and spore germination
MSDELDDLGGLRHFEEGVRMSLHEKADSISPHHRLGAILAAEPHAKRRTGYWLVGAAAAFILVAALSVAFLLQPRTQASSASGAAAPAQNDQAGKAVVTPAAATEATGGPTTAATPWAMPLYEVVTGTSTQPWLLDRVFVSVSDPGDRETRAQAAITALLSGTTATGTPISVYNRQVPWAPGTTAKVVVIDTQIGIVLNQAGLTGLSAAQQRIAVQSLVWTATAAAQLNVPVRVEVTGGLGAFATKPAGSYARPDPTTSYTDLVPIWIDTPTQGAAVTAPVTVSGQACVFEAQFSWQLLQGTKVVKAGSAMATIACPDYGTYAIPLGTLAAGAYTIVVQDISAKDGSVAYETRVTFTVA